VLSERDLERCRRRERALSARRARELAARRRARRVGAVGLLLAAVLPVVLFRRTVALVASEFQLDATYLVTGWTPWLLMALGLLCGLPALARLRPRHDRFYRSSPAVWSAWGVTLYLLGFGLATQVAQIAEGFSRGG
jgi:Mg/Co/Ni transporter MgtE